MNVGRDRRRPIESTDADEPHLGASVLAENRHLARRASKDPLGTPIIARHVDRLRDTRQQLHMVGLDQKIDHERAPGLSLTVQAVATVREERIGQSAGTEPLHKNNHPQAGRS